MKLFFISLLLPTFSFAVTQDSDKAIKGLAAEAIWEHLGEQFIPCNRRLLCKKGSVEIKCVDDNIKGLSCTIVTPEDS